MNVRDTRWRYQAMARFGPFFAVDCAPEMSGGGWAPVRELAEPAVLLSRARAVTTALAAGLPGDRQVPARVAASIAQLGLCARLSAVALGAAVEGLPVPMRDRLTYLNKLGGPYPVGILPSPRKHNAARWPEALLELVSPIAEATIVTFALSPQVVWGNVASGLHGAARMIGEVASTDESGAAVAAEELTDRALGQGMLRGTMTVADRDGRLRRSCCLIYRLAGSTSAVCGDCVLQRR
jgi:FhuF 2Fe-2S C-terminal domain